MQLEKTDQPGLREIARQRLLHPERVQIEQEIETIALWMDNRFEIPILGWRFGLNPIIDLIPGFGDAATSIIALYILVSGVRYRVSKITLARMGINIGIYFLIGLLPFIGDLFAAWWKPNMRNLNLLKRRAKVSAAEAQKGRISDWIFVGMIALAILLLLIGSVGITYLILKYLVSIAGR